MNNLLIQEVPGHNFNIALGAALFSDPQADRANAVVVANHPDPTANIDAGDLVRIDFTVNKITEDGLYVITLDDGWIGYRRFQYMPTLHLQDSRESYPVTTKMFRSIKVVGKVKDICRFDKI